MGGWLGRYVVVLSARTHLQRYGNNIVTNIISFIIVAIAVTEQNLKCLISGMLCIGV